MTEPTPARIASANGHRYNSCNVLSSRLDEMPGLTRLYILYISCSFAIKCLMVAITPTLCTPSIVKAPPNACRTGSEPKPSQSVYAYQYAPPVMTEGCRRTSSSTRFSSQGTDAWPKVDIHTFSTKLFSYGNATATHQIFVPCRTYSDLSPRHGLVTGSKERV